MLLLFIIVYLVFTIIIGFVASRRVKSSGDYMLAGRSLPMLLSTSALFATWFGSETVFGASSEFLKGGLYAVIEDPFGAVLCLVIFGFFFARKLYSMNLITLVDLFRLRFNRRAEFLASIFMVPSYFGYIAGQLVAMGLILNVVTGLDVWIGVSISAFVVTLYTFVGGMWAVSITDFVQSIIIVVGLIVVAVVLSRKAGGAMIVLNEVPAENFKFLPDLSATEITSYIAAWCVLGLGSIPSQDVFQRAMSSGSARIAEYSCYYAAVIYLVIAGLPLFICLCVKHLYPGQIDGDTQLTLPSIVLSHTTLVVQILFFGSLLSAIMSTASAAILAPASIVSENIVKPLLKNPLTDKQFLFITRISVIAISVVSTVMACMKTDIYQLVGDASVFTLVSLFVPMWAALYWKRATSLGAITSMLSGMIAWIFFELFPLSIPSLVPAVIISLVTMIVVSYSLKENLVYDQNRA